MANFAAHGRLAGDGDRSFFYPRGMSASTSLYGDDRRCRQNQLKPLKPYFLPNPVQFVSSNGDIEPTSSSSPAVKRSGDSAADIGQFETHTRGIGSRLMAKMGYIPGRGLGKDGQGITTPVSPECQNDKLGLGFLTAAAAAWTSSESQLPAAEAEATVWPSWDSVKKEDPRRVSANPWEAESSTPKEAPPSSEKKQSKKRQRKTKSPSANKRHEDAMYAIAAALEGAKKQQSSRSLTLSSLMETFSDLKKLFTEEFEICDLSSAAANLAYPLLVEVFSGWKLEEEEELLQGLLLMTSWKDLLLLRPDCLDDASSYGKLVKDVVLPAVKEWGANSWNVRDPQPMIAFLELWELLLPLTVRDLIMGEVVMAKLRLAVESWDPRVEKTPIHVWMLPWSSLLGTRLDSLYKIIRVKMGRVLDSWEPSDQSAFDMLSPWKCVFDSSSWEKMMMKYIVPKLKSAIKKNKQKLEDQFNWVMRWDSVMSTEQIVALLEDSFFRNWLRALESWFKNSGDDTRKVSKWFESWKVQFSLALLADERIQMLLSTALSRIEQAKEKEFKKFWD